MNINNKKISKDKFFEIRKEVLEQWPTGKDVKFNEGLKFMENLPEEKNFAIVLEKAKKDGITLVQPRAGVGRLDEHINLLKHLQEKGGADLLPSTIDSYTRQNRYKEAEIGLEESLKENRNMLNGFPVVNHGVKSCRDVVESLDKPIQARHGTPDARLLSEIIHSAGWSSNEGGGISYNIPYAKDIPIETTLNYWQYCDRLAGLYEEKGVKINREPFGPLTGTLVPPSISNSVAVLEGLLAAEQGVKNITLGYGQSGSMVQDISAIKALEIVAEKYFEKFNYEVELTTVFHQWMGGFPESESQAYGVISWGSVSAAYAGATKIIVKTPHEAHGIPTKEANSEGIKNTKQILNLIQGQSFPKSQEVEEETQLIISETEEIIEKIYEIGNKDIAVGIVRGFKNGILDIPFAPSKYNAGKIMPARDNNGAIRYMDFGNLPISKKIQKIHKNLLEERGKYEKRKVDFNMVIDDIYAVSKGKLIGRPEIKSNKK